MRINKYLALHTYSTRRGADELIKAHKVKINGRVAVLGDQVHEGDTVEVDKATIARQEKGYAYYAYNKPIGIVTEDITQGKPRLISRGIDSQLPENESGSSRFTRLFPVGRLDQSSHGLLLLTNDGRVTERLLNPAHDHEKEYSVKINKPITENFLTRMGKGVKIEDYITKKARVSGKPGSKTFTIILSEGKKHQIRRMVTALGYEVRDLERVRIMNIKLESLALGERRQLSGSELKAFLAGIGL